MAYKKKLLYAVSIIALSLIDTSSLIAQAFNDVAREDSLRDELYATVDTVKGANFYKDTLNGKIEFRKMYFDSAINLENATLDQKIAFFSSKFRSYVHFYHVNLNH